MLPLTFGNPIDVDNGYQLSLVVGDGYESTQRILTWVFTGWTGPALTGATGKLRLAERAAYVAGGNAAAVMEVAATIAVSGSTVTVTATVHENDTAGLVVPKTTLDTTHVYQLLATAGSEDITLLIAEATIYKRVTPTT